jgi:hypothetical protein
MSLKVVKGIKLIESTDSPDFLKGELVLNLCELADWLLQNQKDNICKIVFVENKSGQVIPLIKTDEIHLRMVRSKRKKEINF